MYFDFLSNLLLVSGKVLPMIFVYPGGFYVLERPAEKEKIKPKKKGPSKQMFLTGWQKVTKSISLSRYYSVPNNRTRTLINFWENFHPAPARSYWVPARLSILQFLKNWMKNKDLTSTILCFWEIFRFVWKHSAIYSYQTFRVYSV